MARILSIDTTTKVCSAAWLEDGCCRLSREDYAGQNHGRLLGGFVREILAAFPGNPDAVALSAGPGSYTGLRIGASFVKGICFGWQVPVIVLPTLQVMAAGLLERYTDLSADALLCPMIDARRMEVYAALYDRQLAQRRPAQADIVDADTYRSWLDAGEVVFFGDGAAKCQAVIDHPNARFVADVHPLASSMGALAEAAYREKRFADLAYFEPFYLKEFQASVPKNKVF
ncbi:MAG: tRNA (adenosine(37)-N6)-threonylcarbamoyltransferase complex dimerization subunit type 1 TsaB [Paludibacteraceae bacterium]|nr:tRNA (adenosine(37)-N6)-threonylcarbamoyltransferase complex dimerization subunit type 1 TsaB [Paludibacteraceae bacterium]